MERSRSREGYEPFVACAECCAWFDREGAWKQASMFIGLLRFLLIETFGNRQLKSSLEAEVDLILPSNDDGSYVLELLQREGLSSLSNLKEIIWLICLLSHRAFFKDVVHCLRCFCDG